MKALNLRCCLCFGAYFLQVATFVNFVVVREPWTGTNKYIGPWDTADTDPAAQRAAGHNAKGFVSCEEVYLV